MPEIPEHLKARIPPKAEPDMSGDRDPETRMTIVVHLPQPIPTIARLLELLGEEWPEARVDTNHPEGWLIELRPREP
jgi:hypothetical protein